MSLKRIYKQELDIARPIFLRGNAKIEKVLDMQVQNGVIVFWYEADLEGTEDYVCYDSWTGDKVNDKSSYIGTYQAGDIVYHFYYIKEKDFNIKDY